MQCERPSAGTLLRSAALDELDRGQEMVDEAPDKAFARRFPAERAVDHLGRDIVLAFSRVLGLERIEK